MIPEIEIKVTIKGKDKAVVIKNSSTAYNLFKTLLDADTMNWIENFFILCLNRKNKVIGFKKISSGGITGTTVDPRVIFVIAINTPGTSALILAHNHPSDNCIPSETDKILTKKIFQAGKLLDIQIIDHIIICDDSYYSFADHGDI